ncbi:WD40 repeat domain-containing protein [Fimbriiglobus ruber]|uniref:WD40 repeat domain-containing protein n=1 Tax=Fimbriiglobus ruber TaxID=1908690 RepID=UPI003B84976F
MFVSRGTGRVIRYVDGHAAYILDLAFTPDGSKVLSVSYDHTGLVWDVTIPTFTDRKPGVLTPKALADNWGPACRTGSGSGLAGDRGIGRFASRVGGVFGRPPQTTSGSQRRCPRPDFQAT